MVFDLERRGQIHQLHKEDSTISERRQNGMNEDAESAVTRSTSSSGSAGTGLEDWRRTTEAEHLSGLLLFDLGTFNSAVAQVHSNNSHMVAERLVGTTEKVARLSLVRPSVSSTSRSSLAVRRPVSGAASCSVSWCCLWSTLDILPTCPLHPRVCRA